MGSFVGHVVPGTMFIAMSVWWYLAQLRISFQQMTSNRTPLLPQSRRTKSKGQFSNRATSAGCLGRQRSALPIEATTKICLAIIGILGELLYEKQWVLLNQENKFAEEHLNNYAHATMFGFFGLSGFVDLFLHYKVAPLPKGLANLFIALAFFVEGMLFYFHLDGRPDLNVRLHSILYMIAFFTAAVLLVEMRADSCSIPKISRAYLTSLQGSWFFYIAFVLHGKQPWENASENVEFIAIAFAWHVFGVAVLYLLTFVGVYRGLFAKLFVQGEAIIADEESDEDL